MDFSDFVLLPKSCQRTIWFVGCLAFLTARPSSGLLGPVVHVRLAVAGL